MLLSNNSLCSKTSAGYLLLFHVLFVVMETTRCSLVIGQLSKKGRGGDFLNLLNFIKKNYLKSLTFKFYTAEKDAGGLYDFFFLNRR